MIMDNGKALVPGYGRKALFAADPHRGPGIVREGCPKETKQELRLKGSKSCTGRERKQTLSGQGKSPEKVPAQE